MCIDGKQTYAVSVCVCVCVCVMENKHTLCLVMMSYDKAPETNVNKKAELELGWDLLNIHIYEDLNLIYKY